MIVNDFFDALDGHRFSDEQDIELNDPNYAGRTLSLREFVHSPYGIVSPSGSLSCETYHYICSLFPDSDSTIFIGISARNGKLVSYSIDNCKMSVYKLNLDDFKEFITSDLSTHDILHELAENIEYSYDIEFEE